MSKAWYQMYSYSTGSIYFLYNLLQKLFFHFRVPKYCILLHWIGTLLERYTQQYVTSIIMPVMLWRILYPITGGLDEGQGGWEKSKLIYNDNAIRNTHVYMCIGYIWTYHPCDSDCFICDESFQTKFCIWYWPNKRKRAENCFIDKHVQFLLVYLNRQQ